MSQLTPWQQDVLTWAAQAGFTLTKEQQRELFARTGPSTDMAVVHTVITEMKRR